ncbi:MAG: preprotein translocase subunit SecY, partial [Gammaproteobacteria bacterium]|nr:preprotein translocase subunit SecY [Gammaproteobacteria bacterium]
MATTANKELASALGRERGKLTELKHRLFFLVGALLVWRIGTFIPVPGIDSARLAQMFDQQGSGSILRMFNMFSGGALERLSIFALNVMPYITASIIMQMAAAVHPTLNQIKKDGQAGQRKITQYTRYGTAFLAAVQSFGMAVALQNQGLAIIPGFRFLFIAVVTLVAGSMFLMWLGEQVTERGIGNGISMIILASIVSGLPSAFGGTIELTRTGELSSAKALIIFLFMLGVTYGVV